jgi:hypothetical protein
MTQRFQGTIDVDVRDSKADWAPYLQPVAPEGAPNVLYIVLDDVGFSAMGPWGGLIDTPNIDRLAANGLTYTNWHTTALCSPTRSSLLTGRNHTTNGMACIAEATSGFPNANGHIPFESATIAEVLGERGWNTYMLGKWHLVASDEMNMASTKRNWPVGRGFERYYGFLGGETNQWYPDLIYDNHPVEQPSWPEDGYHLTTDLTDRAIEFIKDAKMIVPDKPFFMYFCPGACHAPHHAPTEWIEKYKGKFDMGYEAYREQVFERQKQKGIFGPDVQLSPLNPNAEEKSVDGKPWPPLDIVRPWDSLSDDEKRLFSRMAEVYAGFLSHADHEIGRLLEFLESSGQLENTIHDRRPGLRQRRQRRGWPQRVDQRVAVLQRHPRRHQRQPQVPRPAGVAGHLQPLPRGLGVGVQHAVQDVEAIQLRGRRRRPDDRVVAQGHQGQGRAAAPVPARHGRRPHDVRPAGRRASGGGEGLHPDPARGCEFPLHVRERRRAHPQGVGLLLDAGLASRLAQGLQGGQRPSHDRRLGPLRSRPLGAL